MGRLGRHGRGVNTETPARSRLARIADAVRAHAPALAGRDPPFFEAAVALVLRTSAENAVEALFIKRAARDDDPWSGQIALPGGRRSAADHSLEETAVRETREEVALDLRRDGVIIGALDELRPRTPVLPPVIVRPFVATVGQHAALEVNVEVADLFWAPLDVILDPAATRETAIQVRGFRTDRPAIHFGEHVIWGMTERILRNFGELLR
jgi:8-oxo-dGTP pyrophosphatase MutT (NUDIX family)